MLKGRSRRVILLSCAVLVFICFLTLIRHWRLLEWDDFFLQPHIPHNSSHDMPDTPISASDQRANASIVMLARESDLEGGLKSINQLEARFNRRFNYPYVLLNEVPFSDTFQTQIRLSTNSTVEFGLIPAEHWFQPEWIDEERATRSRQRMQKKGVKYGDSVSYRNMCRFNSGFFYRHELLQKYRWYWRLEPNVRFHCDINFDPFLFMQQHHKVYSFTLAVYEIRDTIEYLWWHVRDFMKKYPEHIPANNSMEFISQNGGATYNLCHFWSNFEIADMDFWRSPAYTAFFEYLDSTGNFYYERWGDAPIHSIAASLFATRDQIHFFNEIGYQHDDWSHCPLDEKVWKEGNCTCDRTNSFDYNQDSCKVFWDRVKHDL